LLLLSVWIDDGDDDAIRRLRDCDHLVPQPQRAVERTYERVDEAIVAAFEAKHLHLCRRPATRHLLDHGQHGKIVGVREKEPAQGVGHRVHLRICLLTHQPFAERDRRDLARGLRRRLPARGEQLPA
jgi:hypothetical protein